MDPAQRNQAVLILDHEELLLTLRIAIVGASVLLGNDDVGYRELVPHLQGSTGGLLPTKDPPSRKRCCRPLVQR